MTDPRGMTSALHRARTAAFAAHVEAEHRGDLDAIMATLVDDPRYEIVPLGLRFAGRASVRAYYSRLLHTLFARTTTVQPRHQWWGDDALVVEDDIEVTLDAALPARTTVLAVVPFVGLLIEGERIYFGPELVQPMADWLSGLELR